LSLAYFALIVSIVSASALEIAGAKFGAQLGSMAAALGLLAAASSTRKADYEHYVRATSWGRWILIAIPLCIAAQLAPLPLSWAHPIWASAHDVLGGFSLGPITADIGLTVDASGNGLGIRSRRYAMVVEDGKVKSLNVEDTPGKAEVSGAENLLKSL